MRAFTKTDRFRKDLVKLPPAIQKKVRRQLGYLAVDHRHPSLVTKKVQGYTNVWEARVDIHHRMTFQLHGDVIILRAVGPHDLLRKP